MELLLSDSDSDSYYLSGDLVESLNLDLNDANEC